MNSEEILLRFLEAGLIDLKGDDDKLEKLQSVAGELAANVQKNPKLALPYVLIALDQEAPADDQVVRAVLETLSKTWKTYRNTFQQTPIQLVRAILVETLAKAMPSDDHIALIIALCIRNLLPHRPLTNEETIWKSLLFSAEHQVDQRAIKEWTTPSEIKLSPFEMSDFEPITIQQKEVVINAEAIKLNCMATAGPQYYDTSKNRNVALEDGNPHWASQQNQYWVTEFGSRLSTVIANAINKTISEATIEDIDLSQPITRISDALSDYLSQTFQSFSAATSGLERRTNLLWWKEALYSSSIGESYRILEMPSAAVLMAFDLYKQLPCFSPASVTAFLAEAVQKLSDIDSQKTYSVTEFINAINKDVKLVSVRSSIVELLPEYDSRGLVVALLNKKHDSLLFDEEAIKYRLGVEADTDLKASDWARWILGDLMVLRAVSACS